MSVRPLASGTALPALLLARRAPLRRARPPGLIARSGDRAGAALTARGARRRHRRGLGGDAVIVLLGQIGHLGVRLGGLIAARRRVADGDLGLTLGAACPLRDLLAQ